MAIDRKPGYVAAMRRDATFAGRYKAAGRAMERPMQILRWVCFGFWAVIAAWTLIAAGVNAGSIGAAILLGGPLTLVVWLLGMCFVGLFV